MKNVFLILAHKNFPQLEKLIRFLLAEDDHVILHIDERSRQLYSSVVPLKNEFSNLALLEKRFPVYWGSYNQIRATAALINAAAKVNGAGYVHLISGQDLPLMSLREMKVFLLANNKKEFIDAKALPNPDWNDGGLSRMQLYWFDGKMARFTYRVQMIQKKRRWLRPMEDYSYYGGANWFTLTHGCIKWIAKYLESDKKFIGRFKFTRNADEIFIQTLVMMSPFKTNVTGNELRYVNWTDGPEYPRTLRSNDLNALLSVRDRLFARKFDEQTDNAVIGSLLRHLNEKNAVS